MSQAIPFTWVDRHVRGATRQGVPIQQLLNAALIDSSQCEHGSHVSVAQWLLLCMKTTEILGDAAHGLAREVISPSYAPLGLRLALGSSTLAESIKALCKFYESVTNATKIRMDYIGNSAQIIVAADSAAEQDKIQLEETYLIWIFMHCLYYLGGNFSVSSVSTQDKAHFSLNKRHFGIGGVVQIGEQTSFSFPKQLLTQRSSVRAGENVYWECEKLWLDFVDGRGGDARAEGVNAHSSLGELAGVTGISSSTLRRRTEGTFGSYREMRRAALVASANEMLGKNEYCIEAIASELGYNDARAFRRFYTNATGMTPSAKRSRMASENLNREGAVRKQLKELGAAMGM